MSFTIDAAHTHIGFSVKHMMVSTVRGEFKSYRGLVQLDPEDFTKSTFEGEIDVASITTGNEQRDAHLRTGDFFDADNHPVIKFKSTRIERDGDAYRVHGDLTMRGVTRPLELEVEFAGTNKNPWGKTVAGISARGTLNRRDFGVNFNAALETGGVLVADKVKIELDVEAVAESLAA